MTSKSEGEPTSKHNNTHPERPVTKPASGLHSQSTEAEAKQASRQPSQRHGRQEPAALVMADLFATSNGDPLLGAFPKKPVVHPFMDAHPVPPQQWPSVWQNLQALPRSGKSVAYLHIPFCENHCLFCGFYQNPWRTIHREAYADAVIGELKAGAETTSQQSSPIQAVYFGGGTPTALETRDLCRIIEAVRQYLPLASDCEITIEGRIYSFPQDKAKACFDAGANRISIGVQSFDTKLRKRLGRKVSGEEARTFLEKLTALDQGAIVIDLMYGFPDQSHESWSKDVAIAAQLGLDGVDLYALNLIKSSPLALSIEKGKFSFPPAQSELGHFYRIGSQILDEHGWHSISTTHWRRTTRERNLYNLLVKTGANCLAFGSGAGGFLGNYSFRIESNLEAYLDASNQGTKPLAFMMQIPGDRGYLNQAKGQMETGQLHIAGLYRALALRQLDGNTCIQPIIDQWQSAGLLIQNNGWARLTMAGRYWQVTMTQKLIQWIQQNLQQSQLSNQ